MPFVTPFMTRSSCHACRDPMMARVRFVFRLGVRSGKVMWRNDCHPVAPSIREASTSSDGMVCSPPRKMIMVTPMFAQIWTQVTQRKAWKGGPPRNSLCPPRAVKKLLRGTAQRVEEEGPRQTDDRHAEDHGKEEDRPKNRCRCQSLVQEHCHEQPEPGLDDSHQEGELESANEHRRVVPDVLSQEKELVVIGETHEPCRRADKARGVRK